MRFINHIMLRVSLSLFLVLGVWAVLFYYLVVEVVNEETNDVLEDYSTMIIQNFLAGERLPTNRNGSNNAYFIYPLSPDSLAVAKSREGLRNEKILVRYKNEYEPSRVLRQVFRDANDNYYEVKVVTPTIDSTELIMTIWRSVLILFVLLLIVVLLINIWAVKGGLRPLDRFMNWLYNSDIESCQLPKIEESNIREIKELTVAIEAFAQRARRAFEEQKEFIGNASHELQTPIAICQNRLELLCESELSEAQMEDVVGCMATLSRLSKLNRSLLMLSRIENGGFENSQLSINDIVRHNMELLAELYESRGVSVNLKERGSCVVECNGELATTMVVNLIKNSFAHNVNGGEVCIEVGRNFIAVANSGADKPLDSNKIFNRFYQGGAKSGTYGLGLSIVQSICKLYDFKVDYSFVEGLHRFQIKFT
ncbi:MAG: HAMP domain-containing sensor histidine kinase [Rikenellaceae bacterium]